MAHINTALLVFNATGIVARVNTVQREPAVRRAWAQAGRDVARATRSVTAAAAVTRSAWYQSGSVGARPMRPSPLIAAA